MAPLQPYESTPYDRLVCLHISDGKFESLVKLMVDLSPRNEN